MTDKEHDGDYDDDNNHIDDNNGDMITINDRKE